MRKLSMLSPGHRDRHTLRERSTGEHVWSWIGVGLIWGGLFGLVAPVPAGGIAATQGYVVATLIHVVAGAASLGVAGAVFGAWTRPGRHSKPPAQAASAEPDTYRLVIRGSADDHAQARRALGLDRSARSQDKVAPAVVAPVDTGERPAPAGVVHALQAGLRQPARQLAAEAAPVETPTRQNARRERLSA